MERIMKIAAVTAAVTAAAMAAGCRLDPLVDDVPGASAHLLPAGSTVPAVTDDADLTNQVALNDGLDDDVLAMAGGVVARRDGVSAGVPVHYWWFGPATRAPSPLYLFYTDTGSGLTPIDHPGLVDALPGDPAYSPLHTIVQVTVTSKYAGELITTPAALADAIELGLVNTPVPSGNFAASPIVLPGTTLDVGGAAPVLPVPIYGDGHVVGAFRFGGALGVQPGATFQPTSQVSYLREAQAATYDTHRPIFEATIPTAPPGTRANYTPLSVVINVDLAPKVKATQILQDSDLFIRSPQGEITGTTTAVSQFQITDMSLLLQLQFADGQP
jgi:hypothetical protein